MASVCLACSVFGQRLCFGQGLQAFEKQVTVLAESSMRYCVKIQVVHNRLPQKQPRRQGPLRIEWNPDETILSGILLDQEGHVATLGDALRHTRRISATIFDGERERVFKARIIGWDADTNIGVVRLESEVPLPSPILGNSDLLKPGSLVLGLGFSFDLRPSPSVMVGFVSATGRMFKESRARYRNLIETPFLLNPGGQGGPLINSSGEIVGLLLTSYGGGQWGELNQPFQRRVPVGISLSIPMNMLKKVVEEILDKRELPEGVSDAEPGPWLGIVAEEIDDKVLRDQLGLRQGGVMICHVYPGQPAARAGVEIHDILVRWKGDAVQGFDDLRERIAGAQIGESVAIVLIRKGKTIETTIVVGQN